jgi:DNA topoisomerase-1
MPFPGFIEWLNTALVLAGTGGKLTMMTEATGIGQGATPAHEEAFAEIADSEGTEIAEVLDRQHGLKELAKLFPGEPVLVQLAIRRNRPVSRKEGAEVLGALKAAGWEPDEVEAEKLVDMPLSKIVATAPPVDEAKATFNRDYERHPAGDDKGGEFAPKGSGVAGMTSVKRDEKAKAWKLDGGKDVPEHVKKLGIPPAWTDVKISDDPEADLLAIGKDSKGRVQRIYSDKFEARSAAAKFGRNRELIAKEAEILKQNRENLTSSVPKTREAAHTMALVHHTGIRPGSDAETGAAVKAYGATTLEGRHVVVDGDNVRLKFTGKKGVDLDIPVHDREIAAMLKERAATAGATGRLFAVSDADLREYSHTLDGGGFKPKDFRTLRGTTEAMKHVEGLPRAATMKEYEKTVRGIAKQVSQVLGNTPTIALKSYINPSVWEALKPI